METAGTSASSCREASMLHEPGELGARQRARDVVEAALFLHLARRGDERAQRLAIERGSEADAAHSRRLQLGDAEGLALEADHEVHRLRYRLADAGGEADGLGRGARLVGEAFLEVGRHRQVDRLDDRAAVRERLVARHRAVELAARPRARAARGGERREAQSREHARRARVPRIGDDESARACVQRAETLELLFTGHRRLEAYRYTAAAASGKNTASQYGEREALCSIAPASAAPNCAPCQRSQLTSRQKTETTFSASQRPSTAAASHATVRAVRALRSSARPSAATAIGATNTEKNGNAT